MKHTPGEYGDLPMEKCERISYAGARGFPSHEALKKTSSEFLIDIAALDSRMVFGKSHIDSAIKHAERAFEGHRNVAKSLLIETIRYASGCRQISQALEKMCKGQGAKESVLIFTGNINVGIIMSSLKLESSDEAVSARGKNLNIFGITDNELRTVTKEKHADIVLEKIALLDL